MSLLLGVHDREGYTIVPEGAWILDAIALRENPTPTDYAALAPNRQWIVRLNHGWHPDGTIPAPDQYALFAQQCAAYVQGSRGCTRWIVGNETNLTSVEAPHGRAITPYNYVECFQKCRAAIKAVQPNAEVIPAPVAPWSVEKGDWLVYKRSILDMLGPGGYDGLAIHSYMRSNNPADVTSDARMDAPYADRFTQFRAYVDLMNRIPADMRHLPAYLTEFNPLPGWENGAVIPAAAQEISRWNAQAGTQKILCLILYRFMTFDRWGFSDKPAIIAAFRDAAPRFPAPTPPQPPPTPPEPPKPPAPPTPPPQPVQPAPVTPAVPALQWDERLDQRGATLTRAQAQPGQGVWRVVVGEWRDEQESGGRHHVFVDCLDGDGMRVSGVSVTVFWPDGSETKTTDTGKADDHGADFALWNRAPAYGIRVEGASDEVQGLGLGSIAAPHHNIHTSYHFVFQRVRERETPPVAPVVPRPQPPDLFVPVVNPGPSQPDKPGQILYVNSPGSGLKVRAGPDVNYVDVGGLEHGAQVTVYKTRTGEDGRLWAHLLGGGWVAAWLLSETPPQPVAEPPPVAPRPIGALVHPIENPALRRLTQRFGVNPDRYARWGLLGHNGIDWGIPEGTPIRAADSGVAVEVRDDPPGYGLYVKLRHPWGETLYAHLSAFHVTQGVSVQAGQVIGLSGNTGNSTGPHLHFGLRIYPYNRNDGWGGYRDPAPYLSDAGSPVEPLPPVNIVATVREAAREFSVDENLLLSLIWKESSYNPNAVNQSSGAKGLGQFMPNTWAEQAAIVGATDIFDARDNARAAAHYLRSLIQTTGSERRGLWAYVWGPGRVLDLGKPGKPTQPPAEVLEYANTVIHGRDLLDAVLP